MPQTLRFRGVLRGNPLETHEQMEVGGAEGCVEHWLGVPAIPPTESCETRWQCLCPRFWCSWAEMLG